MNLEKFKVNSEICEHLNYKNLFKHNENVIKLFCRIIKNLFFVNFEKFELNCEVSKIQIIGKLVNSFVNFHIFS